jgi:hypothetical protein
MAAPIYQGPGQPTDGDGGGLLGLFGGLFGESTPTYGGEGQPSPSSSGGFLGGLLGGLFGDATPAYLTPPAASNGGGQCMPVYGDPYAPGSILVIPPQGG